MGNMRAFLQPFYSSGAWKDCRAAYIKSVGGLCERCLKRGIINAGSKERPLECHHKIPLTPQNVNDPAVALNWDNLELLCEECHKAEHRKTERRWRCDERGRVTCPHGR